MDERNFIFGTKPKELDETKEVKMRLPISLLIRLHGLKLLTGQNISDTVAIALTEYFHKVESERHAARVARDAVIAATA